MSAIDLDHKRSISGNDLNLTSRDTFQSHFGVLNKHERKHSRVDSNPSFENTLQ